MEIKDKVIIITGASFGIGYHTAKHLSSLGAKMVLAARSGKELKDLEKELPDSLAIITDLKKSSDIKRLVEKTLQKFERIDILINNAGQGMYGNVDEMELDNFRAIMNLNLFSVVELMQEVIPHMRKQGGGMIINVSSQVTRMYLPGMSAYSATKSALNELSMIAREELQKDNISVSIVLPGLTATNFAKNSLGTVPDWMKDDLKKGSELDNKSETGTEYPRAASPELVAEHIAKLIQTEAPEIIVK